MSTSDVNNSIIESYLKQANLNLPEANDRVDWWELGEKIEATSLLFRIVRIFSQFKEYFPKQLQDWYQNQVKDVFNKYKFTAPIQNSLNEDLEKKAQDLAATHPISNEKEEKTEESPEVQIARQNRFDRIRDDIDALDNLEGKVIIAKVLKKNIDGETRIQLLSLFGVNSGMRTVFHAKEHFDELIKLLPDDQAENVQWFYEKCFSIVHSDFGNKVRSDHKKRIMGSIKSDNTFEVAFVSRGYEKNESHMGPENFDPGSVIENLRELETVDITHSPTNQWKYLTDKGLNEDEDLYENLHDRITRTCALDANKLPENLGNFIDTLRSITSSEFGIFNDSDLHENDWQLLSNSLNAIDYSILDEQALDLCIQLKTKLPMLFSFPESKLVKVKIGNLGEIDLPKYLFEARSEVFKNTLSSEMAESRNKEITINVDIVDDNDAQSICDQILEFIKTGVYEEEGNLISILTIANLYGLKGLLSRCLRSAKRNLSGDNVEAILEKAIEISYSPLIVACIGYIQKHREKREDEKIELDQESTISGLVGCIALLPKRAFKFSCAPEGDLQLEVSACKLLREPLFESLQKVSEHICVRELILKQGKFRQVKKLLELFPNCFLLDISQLTHACYQKYITIEEFCDIGCPQIRELIVSHPTLQKEALDKILMAFPNLIGFGNTSPQLLAGGKPGLKEYLGYFADPRVSTFPDTTNNPGRKPKLMALDLHDVGHDYGGSNSTDQSLEERYRQQEQNQVDTIEPYLPNLYFLCLQLNKQINELIAPKARYLYFRRCPNIERIEAPNAKISI